MFDSGKALLNMMGFTFTKAQPNLTVKFNFDSVIVTKMFVQNKTDKSPNIGNTAQICVTLYNRNLTQLTFPNGTIVPMLISPADDPTIVGWFEGVKMIRLRLCNTSDAQPPRYFRFGVMGCFSSVNTVILSDRTTQYPGPLTTSQPRKNSISSNKKKEKNFFNKYFRFLSNS